MDIIIVGGGKIGSYITEQLVHEKHDVTVIDLNADVLQRLNDTLDIVTINGNAVDIHILAEARAETADMIIAATSYDEVNMVCCLTAKNMGAKYSIARIRNPEYAGSILEIKKNLKIDMVINPENVTAEEIYRLLRFPSAIDIETFCRGRVELMGFRLQENDFIAGKPLHSLPSQVKELQLLFCVAERNNEVYIPKGSFIPLAGDKLYIIGRASSFERFFKMLGRYTPKIKKVFVIGRGKIGSYLFDILCKTNIHLKIVEHDETRCRKLSEYYSNAIIINGDGSDQQLLEEEKMSSYDAVVTLTDRDEDNMIISLYASQLGVKKTITKCNRSNYIGLAHTIGLESVVSPKIITSALILHRVRGIQNTHGEVMNALHRIAEEKAEAIEFTAVKSTRYLNIPLKNLNIKENVLVAVIVRNHEIIIPEGTTVLAEGDTIIIIHKGGFISDLNDIYID